MRRWPLWLLLALVVATTADAQERTRRQRITLPETRPPPLTWLSEEQRDHPLAGRMWSSANKSFFKPVSLAPALRRTDFVLIGEVHDNADHHRLQAWMIREATPKQQNRRRPAVVMEMISEDQQADLARFFSGRRTGQTTVNVDDLGKALNWEGRGWPSWRIYLPIADAAVELGLPLAPGDSPRERIKAVGARGFEAVPPAERARLQLEIPLPEAAAAALLAELGEAHCGALPERVLPNMAAAQRLRDATLAEQLIRFEPLRGAILIAGNGHVRRDRAVPWYLARRLPEKSVLSVMLVEVIAGQLEPETYVPLDPDGQAAVDFVWFTPRKQRADPCEAFKRNQPKAPQ